MCFCCRFTNIDNLSGISYNYNYNSDGTVTSVLHNEGNVTTALDFYEYDNAKRVVSKTLGAVGHDYIFRYESGVSGRVNLVQKTGTFTDITETDTLDRTSTRSLSVKNGTNYPELFNEEYKYLTTQLDNGKAVETGFVKEQSFTPYSGTKETLSYTYDKAGNIATVSEDGILIARYHYDDLNRLITEDNYKAQRSYFYAYDAGGNITNRHTYYITSDGTIGDLEKHDTYTYATTGWKDQLTSYNGQSIVYDALGNPTTYRGKNAHMASRPQTCFLRQ